MSPFLVFKEVLLHCPFQLLWREVSSVVSAQLVAPSLVFSKHSFNLVQCRAPSRAEEEGRKVQNSDNYNDEATKIFTS